MSDGPIELMNTTRRQFAQLGLAAAAATTPLAAAKPNSVFGGIQVGINIPYSFRGLPNSADQILSYLIQTNLSAAELRAQPIEASLGAPALAARGVGEAPTTPANQTPEELAKQKEDIAALKKWRLSRSMSEFSAFRKKWEDAGVKIQVLKFDRIDTSSDEILDYCFQMAKAVGADAISCEIPVSKTKRLGQFAAKHKIRVGYHGHGNMENPEAFGRLGAWEQSFFYSAYNGANLDVGHFFAAAGYVPFEWMEEHHSRITHVHLKDRNRNNGPNKPWGQGETPLKETLLFLKKKQYKFQATIELEYPIPEGSNTLAEVSKCVEFCKNILES